MVDTRNRCEDRWKWPLSAFLILFVCTPLAAQSNIVINVQPNVRVSSSGGPYVEPALAANPKDASSLIISASEVSAQGIIARVFVSVDRGEHWSTYALPGMRDGLEQHKFHHALDTWVTFSEDGTAFFSALATGNEGDRWFTPLWLYRSHDGGRNWDGPTKIGSKFDHPMLLSSGRTLYIETSTWDTDPVLEVKEPQLLDTIALLGSEDEGNTFKTYALVAPDSLGHNSITPAVMADGSILLAYYDHALTMKEPITSGRIYVVKAGDAGRKPSAPRFVIDFGRPAGYGTFAVDLSNGSHRGRIYAAIEAGDLPTHFTPIANATAAGEKKRFIAVLFSDDEGKTWSPPAKVSAPDAGPGFFATVAVNREGIVGIGWLEHDLGTIQRFCYNAYFSASLHGKSFSPPQRVSSVLSCPDAKENVAVRYPPNDQGVVERFPRGGDYIGLTASAEGDFHMAWVDGRDGLFQLYTSRIQVKKR